MRKPPPEDGSVCAGADYGAVIGADLDSGDAGTVSYSHVCDRTCHVVPHLYQLVISACHGEVENMSTTSETLWQSVHCSVRGDENNGCKEKRTLSIIYGSEERQTERSTRIPRHTQTLLSWYSF